jgi:hypothetical protein
MDDISEFAGVGGRGGQVYSLARHQSLFPLCKVDSVLIDADVFFGQVD